jgi:hypothetical protein
MVGFHKLIDGLVYLLPIHFSSFSSSKHPTPDQGYATHWLWILGPAER